MKLQGYLIIGAIVLLLGVGIFGGWRLHARLRPCPIITTDTVEIIDPNWHNLSDSFKIVIKDLKGQVEYWKHHRDTIKLPGDTVPIPVKIDTIAILKDYYAMYAYGWDKRDSNIIVKDTVAITQNVPIWHSLTYKLLKPQQVIINNIDNSITYDRYLQFGLYAPIYKANADSVRFNNINSLMLELAYVFPRGEFGIGWQPNTNTFGVDLKATLFKFRKVK